MIRRTGICPDCGFDFGGSPALLQGSLRSAHKRFLEAIAGATDEDLRLRPSPEVWSALEYMAHTRDVVAFYSDRVGRTLEEDRPRLTSPDWAAETDARKYNSEPPADVLAGIRVSCEALADLLLTLSVEDWKRPAISSSGEHRDVLMFARGAAHETEHHCRDARVSLDSDISVTIEVVRLDSTLADALADAFSTKGWNKPREQYAKYLDQQTEGEILCLVAKVDGAVAGYVKVVWASGYPPLRESAIPEIQDLNVLDEFRRRGVATSLLDHAEEEISKRSAFVGIGVGLHPGYNAAQRLYVLRGYVPDAMGVTYKDEYVDMDQVVTFDDDLVLHFTKELRKS